MKMTFTNIVLYFLQSDPDTPETVRGWWNEYCESQFIREKAFAIILEKDFKATFGKLAETATNEDTDIIMLDYLVQHSLNQVDWLKVARKLLADFKTEGYQLEGATAPARLVKALGAYRPRAY